VRRGTYHATYIVKTVEDAVALVTGMQMGVVSSFGEGDDQWEGIDMCDAGATVSILTLPPKRGSNMRHGDVFIEVRVPVEEVPEDYWLSPFTAGDLDSPGVKTFDQKGNNTHGEPCDWGMTFLQPQRRVKK
jgi:hypothetical protein